MSSMPTPGASADLRHLHAGVTARVDALEGAEIHRHIQGQAVE